MKQRIGILLLLAIILMAIFSACAGQQSAPQSFEVIPLSGDVVPIAQQVPLCVTATSVPVCVFTPTPLGVTNTPLPTNTAPPTNTAAAQPTATEVRVTPTQIIATSVPTIAVTSAPTRNLFKNGEFEFPFAFVNFLHPDGYFHIVPEFWQAWYCDGCDALAQGQGNPDDLLMGRPEYKPAAAAQGPFGRDWYSGRNGVTWFCFSRVCQGGLQQTITVPAGSYCELTAMYKSWSNNDDVEGSDGDYHNSQWHVRIALYGNTDWENTIDQVRSEKFEPSYDTWSKMEFSFQVPKDSARVTIYFENLRKWPVGNNDNYLDQAVLRCG
jgi:hypothetical protein